jgi:hypothetical protein
METNLSLKELGWHLVQESKEEDFTAQRGLVNELFPFIYEASKRMSSRAISRWFEGNNVKLSAATIAKALRNPKPYWQELADHIEPFALCFARAHEVDVEELLSQGDCFSMLENRVPSLQVVNVGDVASHELSDYEHAKSVLKKDWFALSLSIREACLANADFNQNSEKEETKPDSTEE